jgi:hypothetical protein
MNGVRFTAHTAHVTDLVRADRRPVALRPTPGVRTLLLSSGVAVIGASVAIGFIGATKPMRFDWALMAGVGTALGTLLLALYTAWLATTTRQEVGMAIEEQRARDRPVVVATVRSVASTMLDPQVGESVSILDLLLHNVGLGPALDLRLWARYPDRSEAAEAVIAVLPSGSPEFSYAMSLGGLGEPPEGGFLVEQFVLGGDFYERNRTNRDDVIVLNERGLRDEQLAAERRSAKRAVFTINPNLPVMPRTDTSFVVTYRPTLHNIGRGTAWSITLALRTADGDLIGEYDVPDPVPGGHLAECELEAPSVHPALSLSATYVDGLGARADDFGMILPERHIT